MTTRDRVRYSETDKMGRVYHSHYLVWFEIARVDFMKEHGLIYSRMEEEQGLFLPVREVHCKYKIPLLYDDEFEVPTTLKILDKRRLRFDYKIRRTKDNKVCAIGYSVHVFIDKEGKLVDIPEEVIKIKTQQS